MTESFIKMPVSIGTDMVCPGLLQFTQPVIGAGIDIDHGHTFKDQVNRRQELHPLQAMLIQLGRREIGSCQQHHAFTHQPFEQATHQHCVSDVGDMKFIEAEDLGFGCNIARNQRHRVGLPLMTAEPLVDFLHEAVEMHPLLGDVGNKCKKAVHQEAFAPAYTAPEIHAADDAAAIKKAQQTAALQAMVEVLMYPLQFLCSNLLGVVRGETVLGGTVLQELDEIGGQR